MNLEELRELVQRCQRVPALRGCVGVVDLCN
jgi:hypothetical protein